MKNPIVVFDRDVKTSEIRGLFKDCDGAALVINGQLIIDDVSEETLCCQKIYADGIDAYANCELRVKGEIVSRANIVVCNMSVEGDIFCMANMSSTRLDVIGDICVVGNFRAVKLRHVGELYAKNTSVG